MFTLLYCRTLYIRYLKVKIGKKERQRIISLPYLQNRKLAKHTRDSIHYLSDISGEISTPRDTNPLMKDKNVKSE